MIQRQLPWAMLGSLYITQYIGVAFIMSAAMAILRQKGVALDQLALINLAVLPMAGKVLYAPIIDKFHLKGQGQYRSWLMVSQLLMASLLGIAGSLGIDQHFSWVLVIIALYVFCMSIQDVSVDGLSCKLFNQETRKLANSIQFSGNLMGNILGGGVILMLYPWLDWQGSLWLLALLTCVSLGQILLFKEPPQMSPEGGHEVDIEQSLWAELRPFIARHKHWFRMMVLYPIGSTCGFALLTPLLVDHGWPLDDIGFAMKIYGSLIGLGSALLATPLITRLGRVRALVSVVLIQALALALMIPITFGYHSTLMVYAAISVHFCSFPALLVVTSTIMMDNAAAMRRKATFFTLQFSVASLLGFAYSGLSMALAKHVGYSAVVVVGTGLTCLIAWGIHRTLPRESTPVATATYGAV